MALPAATKLPLLHAFHERIYDRRGAAPVNCAGPPAARQQARPRRRARRSLVPEPAGGAQDVHGRVRLRAVRGPDAPVPARDRPLPAPGHALSKGAPPRPSTARPACARTPGGGGGGLCAGLWLRGGQSPPRVRLAHGRARASAQVIADITRRMGAGMAEFIEKEVESVADYELYCHYVAGLVGIGLSQARACSDSSVRGRGSLQTRGGCTARGGALSCIPALHLRLHKAAAARDAAGARRGSSLLRAGGRARRWRTRRAWPTTWACSCKRPTSSATTWRTSARSRRPGAPPPGLPRARLTLCAVGDGSVRLGPPRRRMFWPRDVWGRYAERLDAFKKPEHARGAVRCLDALVADALGHAPHCLAYLARLRDPAVFRFCAIPQARRSAPRPGALRGRPHDVAVVVACSCVRSGAERTAFD